MLFVTFLIPFFFFLLTYTHKTKASFYDRSDLNRFLAVLPTELACDIILWTYEQDDEDLENFYFSVDLDLGTFCNDGGSKDSNVEWGFDPTVSTAYASRDIKAGEEILCDYEGDYDYSEEADENDEDEERKARTRKPRMTSRAEKEHEGFSCFYLEL